MFSEMSIFSCIFRLSTAAQCDAMISARQLLTRSLALHVLDET